MSSTLKRGVLVLLPECFHGRVGGWDIRVDSRILAAIEPQNWCLERGELGGVRNGAVIGHAGRDVRVADCLLPHEPTTPTEPNNPVLLGGRGQIHGVFRDQPGLALMLGITGASNNGLRGSRHRFAGWRLGQVAHGEEIRRNGYDAIGSQMISTGATT